MRNGWRGYFMRNVCASHVGTSAGIRMEHWDIVRIDSSKHCNYLVNSEAYSSAENQSLSDNYGRFCCCLVVGNVM